jgi:hypothetical protein
MKGVGNANSKQECELKLKSELLIRSNGMSGCPSDELGKWKRMPDRIKSGEDDLICWASGLDKELTSMPWQSARVVAL